MRLARLLCVAVCLWCVTTVARGADAPPPAAATELARLLVSKEMWAQGVQSIAQGMQAQLQGHGGAATRLKYPADLQSRARAEVEAALPYDELTGMHAKELASRYTPKELDELLAFHRTPTGKRWLKEQPAAFERVGAQVQSRVEQKMPDIMKKLAKLAESGGGKPAEAKASPAKPAAKK